MTDPASRDQDDLKTPLSFKLMVVLVGLYLGWRFVEGVIWVVDRIW